MILGEFCQVQLTWSSAIICKVKTNNDFSMVTRWNYTIHLFWKWVLSASEARLTNPGFCANVRTWSCCPWVSEPLPCKAYLWVREGVLERSTNEQHEQQCFHRQSGLVVWKRPVTLVLAMQLSMLTRILARP